MTRRTHPWLPQANRLDIDAEVRRLFGEGLSGAKIAAALRVSEQTVRRRIVDLGLRTSPPPTRALGVAARVRELLSDGVPRKNATIARIAGCSESNVKAIRSRMENPTPPKGRRPPAEWIAPYELYDEDAL